MSHTITPPKEQSDAQGRTIARIFRLPDANDVSVDWRMDSYGTDKALLRVELIRVIDRATAEALLNGHDLPSPASGSEET